MKLEAGLIEDGGRAAGGPDFFRSPGFLEAEGATHTLVVSEGGDPHRTVLSAPLLVRPIPGSDLMDAISPYGYPGAAPPDSPELAGAYPLDPAAIDFAPTGLVTIFLRHALTDPPLAGATPRNVCLLSDPELPRKSRMSDRQQIRKNLKRGYSTEILPGPESGTGVRRDFLRAYTETMERTGAAGKYFFDAGYFDRILAEEGTWLVIARDGEGEVAAASIAALSDGVVHYYLAGTADACLRDSPMKNVLEALIEFAAGRDLPVNLGGGITPGDRLEEFKRGFTNREEQWFTSEITCDPEASARLAGDRETDFFPPYRA